MARQPTTWADEGAKPPVRRRGRVAAPVERRAAGPVPRRKRAATSRRPVPVAAVPRLVEDDTEVLAAEHAARDAQLLDLLNRLSA